MTKAILFSKVLLCGFALAQLGDVMSTNSALASAGTGEGNPIMAYAMASLGPLWWLPKAGLAIWALYYAATLGAVTRRQIILLSLVFKIYLITIVSNLLHTV